MMYFNNKNIVEKIKNSSFFQYLYIFKNKMNSNSFIDTSLVYVNKKYINCIYSSYKHNYKLIFNDDLVFFFKTKFKINFKYCISFLYTKNVLMCFGVKNSISKNLKKLNRKSRFLTNNYILLNIINSIFNIYIFNYKLIYLYQNINFFNISLFKNFFRILDFFNLNIDRLFFNINFSYKPGKYYKKLKTIKRFKKKIYNSVYKKNFKNIFL